MRSWLPNETCKRKLTYSVEDRPSSGEVGPDRAAIEAALTRIWALLEPYAEWRSGMSRPVGIRSRDEEQLLEIWSELFADEIDVVRRGRNTVSHSYDVTDDVLKGALEIGQRLWELLQARLTEVRHRPTESEWLFQLHSEGRPWDKRADEVEWSASAVGTPVRFIAVQVGVSGWYAKGPVTITAPRDLEDPAWTVSRGSDYRVPIMTGRVGRNLAKGDTFDLPVTDGIVGNVPRD
jgi:hypothetical protein